MAAARSYYFFLPCTTSFDWQLKTVTWKDRTHAGLSYAYWSDPSHKTDTFQISIRRPLDEKNAIKKFRHGFKLPVFFYFSTNCIQNWQMINWGPQARMSPRPGIPVFCCSRKWARRSSIDAHSSKSHFVELSNISSFTSYWKY